MGKKITRKQEKQGFTYKKIAVVAQRVKFYPLRVAPAETLFHKTARQRLLLVLLQQRDGPCIDLDIGLDLALLERSL